jgi:hypothetical protein
MNYLITHDSGATSNGRPLGRVYVTGPHFGSDTWSHTYDPSTAATWPDEESAWLEINRRSWRHFEPTVVLAAEARNLDPLERAKDGILRLRQVKI